MKKKILAFVITILLLSVPLFAAGEIIDNAGLLSEDEKADLKMMVEEIAASYNFNLIILTEESIGGKDAIDYSWDYLDGRGFGGHTWDGCLLLISPGERDYAFTASGRGEKILNKTAYDNLEKNVLSYLKKDNYFGAFTTYINTWEKFLVRELYIKNYNNLKAGIIIDNAGLLSTEEKTSLQTMIDEIAAAYNFNLIILTEENLGGSGPIAYSRDVLDESGLNGNTWDGCLIVVSSEERYYAFTAVGRGEKILTPTAKDKLKAEVVSYIRENNYFGAFKTYISLWENFLVLESKGLSYNALRDTSTHVTWLIIVWVIALVIGLIVVAVMKSKMKTVFAKTDADTYIIPGSMALTRQQDSFLYSTVSKVRRQSSSSGGGGGSRSRSGGGRSSRSGKY